MNTTELLEALRLHQAGHLNEAEATYRRILDLQPNHPDVLHLLGVLAHQRGDHAAAAALIRKALDVDSGNADYHSNLGEAMRALGKAEEALDCFLRTQMDMLVMGPYVLRKTENAHVRPPEKELELAGSTFRG